MRCQKKSFHFPKKNPAQSQSVHAPNPGLRDRLPERARQVCGPPHAVQLRHRLRVSGVCAAPHAAGRLVILVRVAPALNPYLSPNSVCTCVGVRDTQQQAGRRLLLHVAPAVPAAPALPVGRARALRRRVPAACHQSPRGKIQNKTSQGNAPRSRDPE